jgi:hypothetical protein
MYYVTTIAGCNSAGAFMAEAARPGPMGTADSTKTGKQQQTEFSCKNSRSRSSSSSSTTTTTTTTNSSSSKRRSLLSQQ